MNQHFNTRIQNKYDTYAQWTTNNIIPKQGELCIVVVPAGSGVIPQEPAVLFKVGDGTSHFNELPFITAKAGDIYAWAKSENKPTYTASEIQDLAEFIKQQDADTQYKIEASVENPRQFVLYVKSTGGDFVAQDTITIPDTVYTLTEGDTDGTVKFNNTNVSVHGLKSAAFKNMDDFDPAGAADSKDTAIAAAQATADNHIANKENPHGVTAEQTGAAKAAHSHIKADITDFPATMPPSAHTHNASDITAGTFDSARLPVIPVDKGGTGATTSEQARTNLGSEGKHSTTTAALLVSSWISNSQSISVLGVTPNNTIIISPAAESHKAWGEAGIYCSAQAEGMLTFICTKVPSEELTVNIVIMGG